MASRYKPNPWPAEISDNLDDVLGGVKLLNSVSTIGLEAVETANPVSIKMLLEYLKNGINKIETNIQIIVDHYEHGERGRPVKWVKTAMDINERHIQELKTFRQRLTECFRDADWDCVELYLKNLPVLCHHIEQLIEAIPRESYILEESRKIVREALNGG